MTGCTPALQKLLWQKGEPAFLLHGRGGHRGGVRWARGLSRLERRSFHKSAPLTWPGKKLLNFIHTTYARFPSSTVSLYGQ